MENPSIAVILITLNEAHNLKRLFKNLRGWANEIYVLDSYSKDNTVDICLQNGIEVYQRKFTNFGDQWNAALNLFDVKSDWVMKMDPDETLTDELKNNIFNELNNNDCEGFYLNRRLWFMTKPLPVKQKILRIWKKGKCAFTNSLVNEHPVVEGKLGFCKGDMSHFDSPNLEYWTHKQNLYTTAEALARFKNLGLAEQPKVFGNSLQRRMFLKKIFYYIPFRYLILFLYHFIFLGAFRSGKIGYIWSRLRADVYRNTEYKLNEYKITGLVDLETNFGHGDPDSRCKQF